MKKTNVFMGGIFLVLGVILTAILFVTAQGGSTIKLFIAGPPFVLMGLALLTIAKGPEMPYDDFVNGGNKTFFSDASMKDKVIWGISLIGGIAISQLIFPVL